MLRLTVDPGAAERASLRPPRRARPIGGPGRSSERTSERVSERADGYAESGSGALYSIVTLDVAATRLALPGE